MSSYISIETILFIFKIYVGLSTFSILWFTYSYAVYTKFSPNKLKNTNQSKFNFCKRLDYGNISILHSVLGSILYCPLRIFALSFTTFLVITILFILKLIGSIVPWVNGTLLYNYIHILIVKFVGFFTLRLFGVVEVDHFVFKKNDTDDCGEIRYSCVKSDDLPAMDDVVTIVSNHISILDISFFMRYVSCGFVAQKEIRENYILGTVADVIGCIYVDRSCMETRSKARHLIRDRQFKRLELVKSRTFEITDRSEKIKDSKCLFAWSKISKYFNSLEKTPLVIFPEGTTTNGNNIIPFKLGAFESLTPVTPVVLMYNYSAYSPAFDIIPFWVLVCLLFCNYDRITLSAYWLPQMSATESEKKETSTKNFANRVRELMIKVLRKAEEFNKASYLRISQEKDCHIDTKKVRKTFEISTSENFDSNSTTTGSLRLKQEYIRMLNN
ncbi:acyltransferase domain-containing [Cryptosporidium sp. chipmunk genotype I]|uniref:acyltransferase domain-containing n=1 Tax=Cryptosporidium sp. chipmunk genotype I TaxID=1280935 RepID=UPI003519F53F|nr:acyltransferase domain-containing [Cryptosporidium sp. chipmunk genotype I]